MTLEELRKLIISIINKPISSMVETQIQKFYNQGISYKEIGRSVYYFYVVHDNDIHNIDKYGIGIVPKVLNEANRYYNSLAQKQEEQRNAAKRLQEKEIKEVTFKPNRRNFHRREIDISELK